MYCTNCGNLITQDNDNYCNHCNHYNNLIDTDKSSILGMLIAIFAPGIGIILYFLLRENKPKLAKSFKIGVILILIFLLLALIFPFLIYLFIFLSLS